MTSLVGKRRRPVSRALIVALAMLLNARVGVVAGPIDQAINQGKAAVNAVTGAAVSGVTQPQANQFWQSIQQKVQSASQTLQAALDSELTQKRQTYEQQRQALIARERSNVEALRTRQPAPLAGTQTTGGLSGATRALPGALATGTAVTPSSQQSSPGSLLVQPTTVPLALDNVTIDGGPPGVQVGLMGRGFTTACEVRVRVSSSREITLRPDWAMNGALAVTLPETLTGLAEYQGTVCVVRNDGQVSASRPFVFRPRIDVCYVDPAWLYQAGTLATAPGQIDNKGRVGPTVWLGHYNWLLPCSPFAPKGRDTLGQGLRLANGWVVDQVDCGNLAGVGHTVASPNRVGTPDLGLTLDWEADFIPPIGWESNNIVVVVARGPLGLPYR